MEIHKKIWKSDLDKRIPLRSGEQIRLSSKNGAEEYCISNEIGRGASCIVYKACFYEDDYLYHCIIKELYPIGISESIYREHNELIVRENKEEFKEAVLNFQRGLNQQTKLATEIGLVNSTVTGHLYEGNGTYYIVMPYNEGSDFMEYMEKNKSSNNYFLFEVFQVMRSLVKVIVKYHEKEKLLLDIKPQNIFVLPETKENIKLFDCDSVVSLEELKENREWISFSGRWSAPELRNGQVHRIRYETDYYSVGAMIFYALFERAPVLDDYLAGKSWKEDDVKGIDLLCYNGILFSKIQTMTMGLLRRKRQSPEKILSQLDELIILANPETPDIKQIVYPVTQNAVIDMKRLEEIDALLEQSNILMISGIGGSGKTELAKLYAQEYQSKYSRIQFMSCTNFSNEALIDTIAFGMQIRPELDDRLDNRILYRKKLEKYLAVVQTKTLLVIDNFNVESAEGVDQFVTCVNETNGLCKVLFTTRYNTFKSKFSYYEMERFSEEESYQLFLNCYGNKEVEVEKKGVLQLLSICKGHPLLIKMFSNTLKSLHGLLSAEELYTFLIKNNMSECSVEIESPISRYNSTKNYASMYGHLTNIFKIVEFSDIERKILYSIASLNGQKIEIKDFVLLFDKNMKFMSLLNSINILERKGWIIIENDFIQMHEVLCYVVSTTECYTVKECRFVYNLLLEIKSRNDYNFLRLGSESWRSLWEINEDSGIALCGLALCLMKFGQKTLLYEVSKRLELIEEQVPSQIFEISLGRIAFYKRDIDLALQWCEKANDNAPNSENEVDINILLGDIYVYVGDKEKAVLYFKKAKECFINLVEDIESFCVQAELYSKFSNRAYCELEFECNFYDEEVSNGDACAALFQKHTGLLDCLDVKKLSRNEYIYYQKYVDICIQNIYDYGYTLVKENQEEKALVVYKKAMEMLWGLDSRYAQLFSLIIMDMMKSTANRINAKEFAKKIGEKEEKLYLSVMEKYYRKEESILLVEKLNIKEGYYRSEDGRFCFESNAIEAVENFAQEIVDIAIIRGFSKGKYNEICIKAFVAACVHYLLEEVRDEDHTMYGLRRIVYQLRGGYFFGETTVHEMLKPKGQRTKRYASYYETFDSNEKIFLIPIMLIINESLDIYLYGTVQTADRTIWQDMRENLKYF